MSPFCLVVYVLGLVGPLRFCAMATGILYHLITNNYPDSYFCGYNRADSYYSMLLCTK